MISKTSRPVKRERFCGFPRQELQRENPHADQIRAVNALVAFGDRGAHAEQQWALGGPVARGAGTVFLAGDEDQRNPLGDIFFRSFKDRHFGAVGEMAGKSAFEVGDHFVAQADVGEGAAHHDLVISAA